MSQLEEFLDKGMKIGKIEQLTDSPPEPKGFVSAYEQADYLKDRPAAKTAREMRLEKALIEIDEAWDEWAETMDKMPSERLCDSIGRIQEALKENP